MKPYKIKLMIMIMIMIKVMVEEQHVYWISTYVIVQLQQFINKDLKVRIYRVSINRQLQAKFSNHY